MRDPLRLWLHPAPAAPALVAAALAQAMLPPAAEAPPPPWLRPDQRLSFGRALASARRYGGALLADAIGTGKSFIGLAVAQALAPGAAPHVLAPAALLPQWRGVAERLGMAIRPHSHETLSRGRLPGPEPGPVLIDESQRFREPATRRYGTLAPWCVGRCGLLLSATPVVNRLDDLAHQLLLLVRDDALRWAGVASLRRLPGDLSPGALAELVVTGEDRSHLRPSALRRDLRPREPGDSPLESLRLGIGGLALSPDRGIAALLRGVLWQALASSPLAAAEALHRYGALLRHAREAAAAGRVLSRQTIRRIVGAEPEQLVLWPLVAEPAPVAGLALEDLEEVTRLEAAAKQWSTHADIKVQMVRAALASRSPSLVFTRATATVRYLRHHLGRGIAWCTGSAAGLDGLRADRDALLDWFRTPPRNGDGLPPRPSVLLATDVAAEGLDLPLVRQVIHYDLPWTSVRLEQRSGRALRLGARHPDVAVLRLLPPPALEAALHQLRLLERKTLLPGRLGLGQEDDAPWRLRARLAARWLPHPAAPGVATIAGCSAALVAGFRLSLSDGSARAVVRARIGGSWSDDPAVLAELLEPARDAAGGGPPAPRALADGMRAVAALVRQALRRSHAQALLPGSAGSTRRARRRLLGLARAAVRCRNHAQLLLLQRGLALLSAGQTAGEAREVAHWPDLPAASLFASLQQLREEPPRPVPTRIELIGLLLVEPGAAPR